MLPGLRPTGWHWMTEGLARAGARGLEPQIARRHRPSAWTLLNRVPLVLARLFLELVPVLGIVVVGHLVAGSSLGGQTISRLIILAVVDAYAVCSASLCVARMLLSPEASRLRLFHLNDAGRGLPDALDPAADIDRSIRICDRGGGAVAGPVRSGPRRDAKSRRPGAARLHRADGDAEPAGWCAVWLRAPKGRHWHVRNTAQPDRRRMALDRAVFPGGRLACLGGGDTARLHRRAALFHRHGAGPDCRQACAAAAAGRGRSRHAADARRGCRQSCKRLVPRRACKAWRYTILPSPGFVAWHIYVLCVLGLLQLYGLNTFIWLISSALGPAPAVGDRNPSHDHRAGVRRMGSDQRRLPAAPGSAAAGGATGEIRPAAHPAAFSAHDIDDHHRHCRRA